MPTYLYENLATGEKFEVQQRITEPAHTWKDPKTGELGHDVCTHVGPAQAETRAEFRSRRSRRSRERGTQPVKRLIAGAPGFNLVAGDSGGWSSTGYSKSESQRAAEATLGRKLHKPV